MTVNRSAFIGVQRNATPDADVVVLGYDPTTERGEPFVMELADVAASTAFASRFAPLDSPEFVGEISIENDVPGAGYPFTAKVDTGHADGLLDRFTVENNANQARVDINMRGANLNIGVSTSTDANSQGGSIYLVRGTGDSSTPFACYKQGSDSVVGLRITPACGLDMRNTDLTSTAITIQNSTATTKVLQVTNTGALWWGNTGDTVLERKAASVLGVGADDYLRLGSTTTAGRMSASTAGAGAVMWDTDLGQLIVSNGTTWEAVTSA